MSSPIRTDYVTPRALELDRATRSLGTSETNGENFGDVFKKVLNDAGNIQDEARDLIGAFLRGEPVEMHQVMAASEEAQLSLELLVELRNKLTDAYRSVMNLQ